MAWVFRISVRHPKTVILIGFALTILAGCGIARLKLRTDGRDLVPRSAPALAIDHAIRDRFDARDPIVVVVHPPVGENIFNSETLRVVVDLTGDLQLLERIGSTGVLSLATAHGDRVRTGTMKFRTLLDPMPSTPEDFDRLQTDLREIDLYTGTLVAGNGSATAILVGVPDGIDRVKFYRRVDAAADAHRGEATRIDVIGAPVAEALLGLHLLQDLGVPDAALGGRLAATRPLPGVEEPATMTRIRRWVARRIGLVPVALVVMVLIFWINFGSLTAALLPLLEVGACLATVFGVMGYLGVPVYLTIAVMPVILTVVGVADELHIFTRYRQLLRRGAHSVDHRTVVEEAMHQMWRPVTKTSVTTAIGFCSFAFSPIGAVQVFGIFTALGVLFCMAWSLTVIPALLAIIPPRFFDRWTTSRQVAGHTDPNHPRLPDASALLGESAHADEDAVETSGVLSMLADWTLRRRRAILVASLIVIGIAPFGLRRLFVQDSWIDGFSPVSAFRIVTNRFNREFLGTHLLLVDVHLPGEKFSGVARRADVTRDALAIDADAVERPESLVGSWLTLKAATPAATDTRRSKRRAPLAHVIESVNKVDDRIVLTTSRANGFLLASILGSKADQVEYEIDPRPFANPALLRIVASLEEFITRHTDETVGGVHGPASHMATTNFMAQARRQGARRIPDDPQQLVDVWDYYARVRGEQRRAELVDDDFTHGLVTVFLKNANFQDTRRLLDDIRGFEAEHLAGRGITVEFAGDVAVSQAMIGAIVKTQVLSLMGSVAGIILVSAILSRSMSWGLLSALPCGLAVLLNFVLMGAIQMPLGVATSMFAGMTLGIGIDFAIHLLESYRLNRAQGFAVSSAVAASVGTIGPVIIIDAVAVSSGFGVMVLSPVPVNARLGVLLITSMVFCLAATMILLPAILGFLDRDGGMTHLTQKTRGD